MATFLALTCLMRQTVLWICSHWSLSQLDAAAYIYTRHKELQSKVMYLAWEVHHYHTQPAYPTGQHAHNKVCLHKAMLQFTSKL